MDTCLCVDLFFAENFDLLDTAAACDQSEHALLFRDEVRLNSFLHKNSLSLEEDLFFQVHVFDSLSLGEHFYDNGFRLDSGKFAVLKENIVMFKVVSGDPESIVMFLYQFDEHKVAEVPGTDTLYVGTITDKELICRTADAYKVVIAFISS
ncbi:hypothetical protein ACFFJY_08275 [Fictibacillus aquaticus]|uniref:Uncharacterized protein n=1 Tax=Fictibacillus aquaticus TaxID=2021314 RepID=A0A235F997_9BACL|nr:hypothetical protein [Fictibacillus aquaticus]OYD57832.1 hypothetical protein CGZ90_07985 [Fictibacillus aquaticus]